MVPAVNQFETHFIRTFDDTAYMTGIALANPTLNTVADGMVGALMVYLLRRLPLGGRHMEASVAHLVGPINWFC